MAESPPPLTGRALPHVRSPAACDKRRRGPPATIMWILDLFNSQQQAAQRNRPWEIDFYFVLSLLGKNAVISCNFDCSSKFNSLTNSPHSTLAEASHSMSALGMARLLALLLAALTCCATASHARELSTGFRAGTRALAAAMVPPPPPPCAHHLEGSGPPFHLAMTQRTQVPSSPSDLPHLRVRPGYLLKCYQP